MRRIQGWHAIVLLIYGSLSFISLVQAATPTSFCKCTCFKKSMIVRLDPLDIDGGSGGNTRRNDLMMTQIRRSALPNPFADADDNDEKDGDQGQPPEKAPYKQKTCSDCNKSFCLEQGLPDCKDATVKDVTTSCFQRDSKKDEAVVFIFIIATISLLGWALAKPFVGRWMAQAKERRTYLPVSGSQER